eukprot:588316-Hanusia_phi.AAC.1
MEQPILRESVAIRVNLARLSLRLLDVSWTTRSVASPAPWIATRTRSEGEDEPGEEVRETEMQEEGEVGEKTGGQGWRRRGSRKKGVRE